MWVGLWTWIGVPPHSGQIREGGREIPPPRSDPKMGGGGILPPPRPSRTDPRTGGTPTGTAYHALATWWAVFLLRSRRRTFLFRKIFGLFNIPCVREIICDGITNRHKLNIILSVVQFPVDDGNYL